MKLEDLGPDALWVCYQRGYNNLVRSGVYFRQLLRPGLSHTYFRRALPLLQEYAAANRQERELPPGFRERLDACPLSARDLLHLDYAICLGYGEMEGVSIKRMSAAPVMQWPGPGTMGGAFIVADALLMSGMDAFDDSDGGSDLDDEPPSGADDGEPTPPFDL